MARKTSKGTSAFCLGEFSKSAITRHLETCEQRVLTEAKAGSKQQAQLTRKLHLVVEGRDLPMYWMHLEVTASTTLIFYLFLAPSGILYQKVQHLRGFGCNT